ncbi:MAG: hypothetical protein A2V90_00280 [Gammaproteobacteria bacterium RBG_16_57_12]|nr:MAG: hypothetical protein A2V90_00280 [Gammaproteobacteria bacterium RBG_16_57_12]
MALTQDLSSENSARINFNRLLLLRGIAIAGWSTALLVAMFGIDLQVPVAPVMTTLFLWVGLTLASLKWLAGIQVSDRLFLAQLLIDVICLTVLLYFTGGSTNPFTMLFILPLTVAAAVLSGRYTVLIAAITITCYTLLLFFYIPLPYTKDIEHGTHGPHVMGMWSGFVMSASLIAVFVVKMGETLRLRDKKLAEAQEKSLKDEHLVALGTLAAGAAHELGTPLSTMAIVAKELEQELAATPGHAEKLAIIRTQIDRCKNTLANLAASAGQIRAESGQGLALDKYLVSIIEEWRRLRPVAPPLTHWQGSTPAPMIVAERTLTQAIINILNNAADASDQPVEIAGTWQPRLLNLEISDRGKGVAPMISGKLGASIVSTKAHGLGLGLFLSYATLERFGGSVALHQREGGGTCTRLTLPLDKLLTSA